MDTLCIALIAFMVGIVVGAAGLIIWSTCVASSHANRRFWLEREEDFVDGDVIIRASKRRA